MTDPIASQSIETKELIPDLWHSLEAFFLAEKCSGCWCMNHRLPTGEVLAREPAKLALKRCVKERSKFEVMAFDKNQPIGWCAFDRMADLTGLDCAYHIAEDQSNNVWAIHCISVLSTHSKDAVIVKMITAAEQIMKREGATTIEGYPPPFAPSDNTFSGSISIFEQRGFHVKETVSKFYTRMVKDIS